MVFNSMSYDILHNYLEICFLKKIIIFGQK